ncbi:DsbA family protein [Pantoea sp. 1.19]|uniref:DsbA family protein n=1 Tax=Pantoea sp. 1.19 TaxID=1925589 RepID=UPI000948B089|nr:DsbA family protein [Pantoea sp. 1.19]
MLKNTRFILFSYSLVLIIVSSLATILCYHLFVFNTFSDANSPSATFRELNDAEVKNSPISEDNTIIEVLSLGCHYCAVNADKLQDFARTLPANARFQVIHLTQDGRGLSAWAPLFATLEVMGIEERFRDSAWHAIITRSSDLNDPQTLQRWLADHHIDEAAFQQARHSDAVRARLQYMADVTRFYRIDATPMFIINKRYVVAQDSDFAAFAARMRQLLAGEPRS